MQTDKKFLQPDKKLPTLERKPLSQERRIESHPQARNFSISAWESQVPIPQSYLEKINAFEADDPLHFPELDNTDPQVFEEQDRTEPFIFSDFVDQSDELIKSQIVLHELENTSQALSTVEEFLAGLQQGSLDYQRNFEEVRKVKETVIEKINKFYYDSSALIDQQRSLVDVVVHVQTIQHYFKDLPQLQRDVGDISLNVSNIHIYEANLQRFLSEIMDAIEFFESKPNYFSSYEMLESYQKLKKKLLTVIKTMLIKLFTKDHNQILAHFDKFKFEELLYFQAKEDGQQPPPLRGEHALQLQIKTEALHNLACWIYPAFTVAGSSSQNFVFKGSASTANKIENVTINKPLKDLLCYMKVLSGFDADCNEIMQDLFSSYYSFFRISLQEKILENLSKLFISKFGAFERGLQQPLRVILTLACQAIFFELAYHNSFFNNTLVINESSKIGTILRSITAKYTECLTPFLQREGQLEELLRSMDFLNKFIDSQDEVALDFDFKDAAGEARTHFEGVILGLFGNSSELQGLIDQEKKLADQQQTNFQKMVEVFKEFTYQIRIQINNKLWDLGHQFLDGYINNFDLQQYQREFNQKYNSKDFERKTKDGVLRSPYFRVEMKEEIMPVVKTAINLLYNLKGKLYVSDMEILVNEVISDTVNMVYLGSEMFPEKSDSFLFLLKNLIFFNIKLKEFDINAPSELTVPKKKNAPEPGFLNKLLPFGGPKAKKSSQKMEELASSLNMNVRKHIYTVAERFIKDLGFIISKSLYDFLKRYQYLESLLAEADKAESEPRTSAGSGGETHAEESKPKKKIDAEGIRREMSSMLKPDTIQKYYQMFIQNVDDVLNDLLVKMKNYLQGQIYDQVCEYVEEIILNMVDNLNDYFILVSKHYEGDQYNEFGFIEIDVYKNKLLSLIKK